MAGGEAIGVKEGMGKRRMRKEKKRYMEKRMMRKDSIVEEVDEWLSVTDTEGIMKELKKKQLNKHDSMMKNSAIIPGVVVAGNDSDEFYI
jgi:hypothetical protein